MTLNFLLSIDAMLPGETCSCCKKRPPSIWYLLDYRDSKQKASRRKNEPCAYIPYCENCCEHLALGMLRDVAEIKYGQEKADNSYRRLTMLLRTKASIVSKTILEMMKEENKQMKNMIFSLESKPRTLKQLQELMGCGERCTSTKMLQEAIRHSFKQSGVVLDSELEVKIKRVKLTGPGIELIHSESK